VPTSSPIPRLSLSLPSPQAPRSSNRSRRTTHTLVRDLRSAVSDELLLLAGVDVGGQGFLAHHAAALQAWVIWGRRDKGPTAISPHRPHRGDRMGPKKFSWDPRKLPALREAEKGALPPFPLVPPPGISPVVPHL
jgi:hypothetical protein